VALHRRPLSVAVVGGEVLERRKDMTPQEINKRFAELAVVSGYRAIIDDNSDGVGKERIDFCADPVKCSR